MLLVERHEIKGTSEIISLCQTSKELYNKCNYYMRQAWFGGNLMPNIQTLVQLVQAEECFKNLHNTKTAKQTVRKVLTDWSNFKKALNAWKKDKSKFTRMPKPPHYKDKLAQVIFYAETVKKKMLKRGIITPTNECFGIKSSRKFKQVVITPKTFGFVVDVQYEQNVPNKVKTQGIACVDVGLNNMMTITSDQHSPILVNGRIIKSINQWFNKKLNKHNSRKRYWRLENYFHHASKFIIQNCVKHSIGCIIIGKNNGWKQNLNLGKKTNQNFYYIPFWKLLEKIKYKAAMVGIDMVFTEEAYTSKASFLDHDHIPAYEEGVAPPVLSGTRRKGMYRTFRPIHADVNGSLNIGRKVIGDKVYETFPDRSIAAMPVRVNPLKVFSV